MRRCGSEGGGEYLNIYLLKSCRLNGIKFANVFIHGRTNFKSFGCTNSHKNKGFGCQATSSLDLCPLR